MTMTRKEVEQRLIERAMQDDSFRAQLLEDSKAAIEAEIGTELPDFVDVQVFEETADTQYLVIPQNPAASEELNDDDLDAVEGGLICWNTCNNQSCNGVSSVGV